MPEKTPQKSVRIERDSPAELNSGDLVRIRGELPGELGEIPTYRAMSSVHSKNGILVWVGPENLTMHEIEEFHEQLKDGTPRGGKSKRYKCVSIDRIDKILDS